MQALDPEMDSFDKLMTLCFSVHDLIESDIPVGLLASLYSSQVVTKGDKHLLNQNRFYYKMVNQLVDEGQRGADYPQYAILRDCTYVCTLREGNHL